MALAGNNALFFRGKPCFCPSREDSFIAGNKQLVTNGGIVVHGLIQKYAFFCFPCYALSHSFKHRCRLSLLCRWDLLLFMLDCEKGRAPIYKIAPSPPPSLYLDRFHQSNSIDQHLMLASSIYRSPPCSQTTLPAIRATSKIVSIHQSDYRMSQPQFSLKL